jgi:hypothetical protein
MNNAYERQIIARYEREVRDIPQPDTYATWQSNIGPAIMLGAIGVGFLGIVGLGIYVVVRLVLR